MKNSIYLLLGLLVSVALIVLLSFLSGEPQEKEEEKGLTMADHVAICRAYRKAEAEADARVQAVRKTVLGRKDHCASVVASITGYRAMWECARNGEEGLRKYVEAVIAEKLISESFCMKLVSSEAANFVLALRDIEDELAEATQCYSLSLAPEHAGANQTARFASEDLQLMDAMQKHLLVELTAAVGSEVATQMLIGAGILATGSTFSVTTLGTSMAAGLVVNLVLRCFVNPTEKVEKQLNDAMDDAAEKQSELFRDALRQILDQRRRCWEAEITAMRKSA